MTLPTHETGARATPALFATPDLPGIGGRIKARPEDFLVDEIPLYNPSGEGEHIYLCVEKRDLSTMDLVSILARHFGVPRGAIGYAGLKDKVAVTRQVVSIHAPGKSESDFPMLRHEKAAVLWADRHANKLRRGHLRANRFSIRIREVPPTAVVRAKRVLDRLASIGVPNRFGPQRFGALGTNHLVGAALVRGDFDGATRALLAPSDDYIAGDEQHTAARDHFLAGRYADAKKRFPPAALTERSILHALERGRRPKQAWYGIPRDIREFYLSAWQSSVFNAVLDARLSAGTLSMLLPGDLAMKHEGRAVFAVDDATAADPTTTTRLAAFEISPSGPMWGAEMTRAAGTTDATELAALAASGVTTEQLEALAASSPGAIEGARRPLRVRLEYPEIEGGVDEHGPFVRVQFELPRGAFATVALDEIMKTAGARPASAPSTAPVEDAE